MAELAVVAIFGLMMIGLSVQANDRFRREKRLPMQWSLSGSVTWSAPRALALSLTPALGTGILAFSAIMMQFSDPRPGQQGLEMPVLLLLGGGFTTAHIAHLWMIARTVRGTRH